MSEDIAQELLGDPCRRVITQKRCLLLDDLLQDENFEWITAENGLKLLRKAPVTDQSSLKNSEYAYPAIVWIHGGGFKGGSAAVMKPHMSYFARLKTVQFSVEYRLAQGGISIEDSLADCKAAVRHIRRNAAGYHIDPSHIIAIGESAGALFACCLSSPFFCEKEERADFCVDVNGVIDMTMKWKKSLFPEEILNLPFDSEQWLDRYEREFALSPIYHITSDNSPILFYHGLLDTVVEPEESMLYYRLLKQAGVKTGIRLLPDVNHAFLLFRYNTPHERVYWALTELADFMAEAGFIETACPDGQSGEPYLGLPERVDEDEIG